MPVLVTGATGLIGRALCARLREDGAEVRAYIRRDDAALRALGVHVAIGAIGDVERLESALTRVHTLVHLVGGLWPERGSSYDALNRDSTEGAVIAARAADVKRVLFMSSVGADSSSSNEYLASKGRAERHVVDAGLEYVIFRSAPVIEGLPRTLERLARGPVLALPRSGAARTNAVALDVVVEALLAADQREAAVAGTWELGGPAVRPLADWAAAAGERRRVVSLGPLSAAPRAVMDLFAADLVADPAPAGEQFGIPIS